MLQYIYTIEINTATPTWQIIWDNMIQQVWHKLVEYMPGWVGAVIKAKRDVKQTFSEYLGIQYAPHLL